MAHTILTIAGSLRKESFSLKIANAMAKLAPASLKLDEVTIRPKKADVTVTRLALAWTPWRTASDGTISRAY